MSIAIAGTTLGTVTLSNISAQLHAANGFCVDDTYGYFIGSNFALSGSLYRCPLDNWSTANTTQVYGAGFLGTGSAACWIQGGKIYSIEATSTSRILSANIDGSSPSATVEWANTLFASGVPASVHIDGSDVLIASATFRYLARLTLATTTISHALSTTTFVCGVGPCRFEANSVLVGTDNPTYLGVWNKDTGHIRIIAGSGTTANIAAGNAFTAPINRVHWPSSDEDGRVYFISNSRLWMLASGAYSQLGAATSITQMRHLFSRNRIVAGSGSTYVLYS